MFWSQCALFYANPCILLPFCNCFTTLHIGKHSIINWSVTTLTLNSLKLYGVSNVSISHPWHSMGWTLHTLFNCTYTIYQQATAHLSSSVTTCIYSLNSSYNDDGQREEQSSDVSILKPSRRGIKSLTKPAGYIPFGLELLYWGSWLTHRWRVF